MEGVALDSIILFVALVTAALLLFYLSRKFRSNQEGTATAAGSEGTATGAGDAAPGRLARHPGGECPICLSTEVASPVQTNCGHWFCARCILGYYDGLGRAKIKCPLCRQEVTMLHEAAEDPPTAAAAAETAAAASEISAAAGAPAGDATPIAPQASSPSPPPPPPPVSPEMQERIARFNDRNSGRRRSPWQVIEDAPLLLQRLWSDLRRGDTQVFGELIRRGVQLQLFVVALYILSPVDFMPESLLGVAGLLDDLVVAIVLLLHITTVYRTILLSWERARAARAAAVASGARESPAGSSWQGGSLSNSPMGAALAGVVAVAAGAAATFAGASSGVSAFAAAGGGFAAAAVAASTGSSSNAQPPTPAAATGSGRW